MWRFRGSPWYLSRQAERLNVHHEVVHLSRHNAEIYRLATLISQLCEQWHRSRKEHGVPVLRGPDLDNVTFTLARCEIEAQKLQVLAAAAGEMVIEARNAFGLGNPGACFEVNENSNIHPPGDGTVGITDDELEPALSESG
jgi:hypothetical protein